mgnify:CR=1 FL=1
MTAHMQVPLTDLAGLYSSIRSEVDAALQRVVSSGGYILGPEVEAHEHVLRERAEREPALAADAELPAIQSAVLRIREAAVRQGLSSLKALIEAGDGDERAVLEARSRGLAQELRRLQELLQSRGLHLPAYAVEEVSGEPHEHWFVASCEVAALDVCERGEGSSRRRAEQEAAQRVLEVLAPEVIEQ